MTIERAAVLIGVSKSSGLPPLQAVTSRVRQLASWAQSQGIPDSRIKILTDESDVVRVQQITDAIEQLVDLPTTVEQLIVYFAGHGIYNQGERWLLSGAPRNVNEAVNVEGSVLLARYCGIRHVVCISDACRTAPEGIEAQSVAGSNIFPNEVGAGEWPVDVFFACARGKPALEIRDPVKSAGQFSALYTDELLACLKGERPDVLDYVREDGADAGYAHMWALADHLREKVPALLREKFGVPPTVNQTPIERINSRNAWLARVATTAGRVRKRRLRSASIAPGPTTPIVLSQHLVATALAGDTRRWKAILGTPNSLNETALLQSSIANYATQSGPMHFETDCGLKLRGARTKHAHCSDARAQILDTEGTIIRIGEPPRAMTRVSQVLIELSNGSGVLIPAIPQFIAELSFADGELVNVAYEPSDHSPRWPLFDAHKEHLRSLRASIAAAVSLGALRLTGDDADKLAGQIRLGEGLDPGLALYAAYAYHQLQRRDLIDAMQAMLRSDLQFLFFDIALLSGAFEEISDSTRIAPALPMLSQGWSLLSALRVKLPDGLDDLQRHLLPSIWTMFDASGVARLRAAIESRKVR